MELIVAILIAIGAITSDEARNYSEDDMTRIETMMSDNGVTEKTIDDYEETGIIKLEEVEL